ncbi:MAG: hypothetical protein ACK2UO_03100, partial [Caldilineaceae bacterium]
TIEFTPAYPKHQAEKISLPERILPRPASVDGKPLRCESRAQVGEGVLLLCPFRTYPIPYELTIIRVDRLGYAPSGGA